MPRRAKKGGVQPSPEDEDDIGLVSTDDELDPNKEYHVEAVLSERPRAGGGLEFLLKWSQFPFGECTWEPDWNLEPGVKDMWEARKKKIAAGILEPFDLREYEEANLEYLRSKLARHDRRNAKRRRLGLPETRWRWDDDDDESAGETGSVASAGVDAPGADTSKGADDSSFTEDYSPVDHVVRHGETSTKASKFRHQESPKNPEPTPEPARPPNGLRRTSAGSTPEQDVQQWGGERPNMTESQASHPQGKPEGQTGYQGTARKKALQQEDPMKSPHTAVKASETTQNRPQPAQSQPSSGSTATTAQKSNLSMKRSRETRPAVNVFIGGKTRKPRQSLGQAMSDTTKTPNLFTNASKIWKAELRGRDNDDRAPELSSIIGTLFDISRGPKSGPSSLQTTEDHTQEQDLRDEPASLAMEMDENTTLQPAPGQTTDGDTTQPGEQDFAAQEGPPKKKKRKSVRFLSEDISPTAGEPVDFSILSTAAGTPTATAEPDHGKERELFAHRSPPPNSTAEPPSVLKSLSLVEYRQRPTQSVVKAVRLGPDGSSELQVTFNGVSKDTTQTLSWLAQFLRNESLHFRYTCLAKTFITQMQTLGQGYNLGDGTITSEQYESVLESVAERLISTASALYYFRPGEEYVVVLFPIKSDEWKSDALGVEPISPGVASLGYMILSSAAPFIPLQRPLSATDNLGLDVNSTPPAALVFKTLFNMEYSKLLPGPSKKEDATHYFFLIFPPSKSEMLTCICAWLRACQPQCRIYTSQQDGAWLAFLSKVSTATKVAPAAGVVIFHEVTTWTIRRFPDLVSLLNDALHYTFWCFSDPSQSPSLFSPPEALDGPTDRVGMGLSRCFPHRTAILITPSFIVSEPRRAFQIFDWFIAKKSADSQVKLVTCWDINAYLYDLAVEKSVERDALLRGQSDGVKAELEASLRGLTTKDCQCRFMTAQIMSDMMDRAQDRNASYVEHGESGPVICADQSIDPNDEQSLVNWFGWWSTMRMDQFRKFRVVGTSNSSDKPDVRRSVRTISIPEYSATTVNDPDRVAGMKQENEQAKGVAERPHTEANGNVVQLDATTPGPGRPPVDTLWQFKSKKFASDGFHDLTAFLSDLGIHHKKSNKKPLLTLYKFPVSWLDFDMADHLGNYTGQYRRFTEWFKFALPFHVLRCYVGLFYTIEEEWDPAVIPRNHRKRHPWVLVYRPVNLHRQPFKACELIIWDCKAAERFPGGQTPTESGLLYMQRKAIQFVREHTKEKNPFLELQQVWLGGFKPLEGFDSPYPLDQTAEFLQRVADDIRGHLPAPEHAMPAGGFKKITVQQDEPQRHSVGHAAPPGGSFAQPEPMNIDCEGSSLVDQPMDMDTPIPPFNSKCDSSRAESTRIIFHPPRGSGMPPGAVSKCRNHLHEQARVVRLRDPGAKTMEYEFRPTMAWYQEQGDEDRAFGHILVGPWEVLFKVLRLPESWGTTAKVEGHGQGHELMRDAV